MLLRVLWRGSLWIGFACALCIGAASGFGRILPYDNSLTFLTYTGTPTFRPDIAVIDLSRGTVGYLELGDGEFAGWQPGGRAFAMLKYVPARWRPRRLLVLRRLDNSTPEQHFLLRGLLYTSGAWSPDGRWLVYSSAWTLGTRLWVLDTQTGITSALTTEVGVLANPIWSPDGRAVLYSYTSEDEQALHLYEWDSGLVRSFPFASYLSTVEWSPDSTQIAVAHLDSSDDRSLFLIDSALTAQRQITFGTFVSEYTWSPDGREIAYVHRLGQISTLTRLDLQTHEERILLTTQAVIGSLLWLADEALYYTADSVNGRQVLVGIDRQGREFRRITLPDGFAGGLVLGP
ncbi:MAG: hypothetical protein U0670_07730 [Anaerolineae bacterium]